ncbi:unnamed protein product [Cercopithifilaria johnstoni]|uniref:Uncharacterized protein n=1 Tax=Cercopithifilaria johnstoni TaxID=2874296 RepID=A0A8J2MQ23_9BILA|nr:unnamed protein product [Cercopithifilaria johnstoni]
MSYFIALARIIEVQNKRAGEWGWDLITCAAGSNLGPASRLFSFVFLYLSALNAVFQSSRDRRIIQKSSRLELFGFNSLKIPTRTAMPIPTSPQYTSRLSNQLSLGRPVPPQPKS